MARENRTGATAAPERTETDGRFTREAAAPTAGDVRARQREEFGGINWGSAFFGWLVAVGVAVLLVAIISAAGAAVGLTSNGTTGQAKSNADTVGIVGGILLLIVLMIA